MIKEGVSRDGLPIIFKDSVPLCSKYYPLKDAQKWAFSTVKKYPGLSQVVILGLAAGYHVEQLAHHTRTQIIVLETDLRLIHWHLRKNPAELPNLRVIFLRKSRRKKIYSQLFEEFGDDLLVLVNPYCPEKNSVSTLSAFKFLTLRKLNFIKKASERYPWEYEFLRQHSLREDNLSILDICQGMRVSGERRKMPKDEMIWRTLSELII